jgi:signal transduction histidine kinase
MNGQLINLLLVEDNPADANLIKQAFSRFTQENWQFVSAETLEDAIATYQTPPIKPNSRSFDLVLLDLGLPDAKGLDTVQQFLAASPEAPVIVLSGLDDEKLALQAISVGAQDYLVKDQITLQALLKAIRFALRRQQTLSQIRQSETMAQQSLSYAQTINEQQIGFIGMVSHELRNPLGIVQSSAELIQMNLEEAANAKIQKWMRNIQTANDQVIYLLNDVLTLCRLRPEHLNCQYTCMRFRVFFANLITEVQQNFGQQHTIEFNLQADLGHTFTDINLIKCIFSNLLSNAIKYTPEGGTIQFTIASESEWITLTVQDSGIGIPEDEQCHLFEHFYRASNANHIQGTGLGLAIVKHCVATLKGHIKVESQVDRGTTFQVQLPLLLSLSSNADQTAVLQRSVG